MPLVRLPTSVVTSLDGFGDGVDFLDQVFDAGVEVADVLPHVHEEPDDEDGGDAEEEERDGTNKRKDSGDVEPPFGG